MRDFIIKNLIFVFLILFFVFSYMRGRKLGLAKKMMSILMLIATIVVTKIFTPIIANIIKDVTNIESTITDIICEAFNTTNLFDEKLNIAALEKISGTEALIENMKNNVATSVSGVIINVMCGIIIFIVTLIALKIIFRLLDIIDYVPVVSDINKFLGGVFGLLESLILVWLLFAIIRALDNNIPAVHETVEKVLNNIFVKYIYEHNIIYNLFNSLFMAIKKV